MYRPAILSCHTVLEIRVGDATAALLTNIIPAGLIRFGYVMEFCDRHGVPCFYVAAEEDDMHALLGTGSHFLCTYVGGSHHNYGSSNEWTDAEAFTWKAIELFQ